MDGSTKMSEIINFDCVVEKNLFFKESYKIYSVKVDKEKYPDIVLNPVYHTAKMEFIVFIVVFVFIHFSFKKQGEVLCSVCLFFLKNH